MSRSRRKPKIGFAVGKNTEYYRERNRHTRVKNKAILQKAFRENNFDDLEFIKNETNPQYDSWNEPTDGSYLLDKDDMMYEKYSRK